MEARRWRGEGPVFGRFNGCFLDDGCWQWQWHIRNYLRPCSAVRLWLTMLRLLPVGRCQGTLYTVYIYIYIYML